MATNITKKQQELLTLFPQFRFLTKHHIQQFLNHKNHLLINQWINDLVTKEYVQKVTENIIKQFPPKPVVYYLGKNGRKFLSEQELREDTFLRNLYYDNKRSESFMHTNLLLADICLYLKKQNSQTETFQYITRADYSNPDSDYHFLSELHPHLCSTKKVKGKKLVWYLLEVFPFFFPNEEIRRRIHAYVKFLKDKAFEEVPNSTMPVILFICKSKEMQGYIRKYLKKKLKQYDIDDYDISLALEGNIWDEV
jgi:hypothetical protein